MAPDGRLYNSGRKGELFELKQGLNSSVAKERKTALKRTVAAMTLGKDVSSLFTDVIKNTASDLAMKKLVYLYIINYAKSNPDLSLLVINTFIKDAADPHPLIRALAIRTMALIPLSNITEYLCGPLRAALADSDPYVQKTAAIAVAKLYDSNPTLVRDENFIPDLQKLLAANNPMTVANAVAALAEIANASNEPSVLELSASTVPRYLASLSECTEWGQVFILDAVCAYRPSSSEEADTMVERVVPRLQHSNAAVVLSAVRLIFGLISYLDSSGKRDFLAKKISPPLLSLLTAPPEMQFVALRNISLLAQSHPELLTAEVKMFFVSYSDPLYVKVEKLDILVRLANQTNAEIILTELLEYTGEVDVPFVRRAVGSIGRIIVKQPSIADRGVANLVELLNRRIPHIVEEVAVALADVLRAYPGQFEVAISALCEASSVIDDPVARSALVWIIGEHAGSLPGVIEVLNEIVETLAEEPPEVQLQILSACFKALMAYGDEAEPSFRRCAEYATVECVNIEVRERGFLYLRLAGANRNDVKKVVLSKKPGINAESHNLEPKLLAELLASLGSLASVYHKPTAEFVGVRERLRTAPVAGVAQEEDLLGLDANGREPATETSSGSLVPTSSAPASNAKSLGSSLLDDLFGGSHSGGNATSFAESDRVPDTELHFAEGLRVWGGMVRDEVGRPAWGLTFENQTTSPMSKFAMLVDKNAFGLGIAQPLTIPPVVDAGRSAQVSLSMIGGAEADLTRGTTFGLAVRFFDGNGAKKVIYMKGDISDRIEPLLDSKGAMPKAHFLSTWQSLPDSAETVSEIGMSASFVSNADAVKEKLKENNIFTVARRTVEGRKIAFCSAKLIGPWECGIMCELSMPLPGGPPTAKLASRCLLGEAGKPFLDSFNSTIARLLGR